MVTDMPDGRPERFPSKIDFWLIAVMVVALVPILIRMLTAGESIVTLLLLAAPVALVGWIFSTTYYVVTENELIVRSGWIRRRIPIKSISRIKPTRNPLSAPALSLDRLEVEYGTSAVLISPKDRDGFLQAIRNRGGGIAYADDSRPSRMQSRLKRVMLFIVLPGLALIAALIYMDAQPPVVDVANGQVEIRTSPRQTIPFSQITGLTLENVFPRIRRKQSGLDFGHILHGRFVLEGNQRALLYVQSNTPPVIKLQARDMIYINYSEPERTRQLYERLTRELNR